MFLFIFIELLFVLLRNVQIKDQEKDLYWPFGLSWLLLLMVYMQNLDYSSGVFIS